MDLPRVPPSLVGGIADLRSLFVSLGRYRKIAREDTEKIAALVPQAIQETPCFLDRLTGLWRYDFGEPLNLPGDSVVLTTNMYQPVDRLYDVLACARRRLTADQLKNYLKRLADPKKHDDLLSEFAPIVRLPWDVRVSYEVPGYGAGNRTVDWVLQASSGPPIAIDRNKVHVALLGDWNDDVYTLAHDAGARQHAVDVLGVRESKRFVFRQSEG